MPKNLTPWVERTTVLLNRCKIVDVIAIQLRDFIHVHKCRPELIVVSNMLRSALVQEWMAAGFTAEAAVQEPVWLDGIPVLFRPLPDNRYLVLSNRAMQVKEVI